LNRKTLPYKARENRPKSWQVGVFPRNLLFLAAKKQIITTTDKKHQAQIFSYAMVSFIIELTIPKGCQIKIKKGEST
jgi:hypothetical protein